MKNPRITAKDRNLIKGALRRAFARSDLHKAVLDAQSTEYTDENRPRCRYWCWCAYCGVVTPRWKMVVDHISPVIPVDKTFESLSLDESAERIWCEFSNLQGLCPDCHGVKTSAEKELRKTFKKAA